MTFFELIRNSLIMDCKRNRPPGTLIQSLFSAWQTKEKCTEVGQSNLSDPSNAVGREEDE